MENILAASKKLNVYFQYHSEIDFKAVAKVLNELTGADILFVSNKKEIVGSCPEPLSEVLPDEYLTLMGRNISENFMVGDECCTAVPVLCSDETYMIIAVLRNFESGFSSEQVMLLENTAAFLALKMEHKAEAERKDKALQKAKIKAALNVLSYSELQAAVHILGGLEGKSEGFVVASKIADNIGLTRSVVVNAVRKLQSATLIESKSLGMKGTFIKILNPLLLNELKKENNMIAL